MPSYFKLGKEELYTETSLVKHTHVIDIFSSFILVCGAEMSDIDLDILTCYRGGGGGKDCIVSK